MTVATVMPQCVEQEHAAQLDRADDLQARSMAKLLQCKLAPQWRVCVLDACVSATLHPCVQQQTFI